MKSMSQKNVDELLAMFPELEVEFTKFDDEKTYELFQNGDTDGIFMMEGDWTKYDLRQIKPSNLDELTVAVALSHGEVMNPFIYTYIKVMEIHPMTYPLHPEIEEIKTILSDTRGLLLYKEQAESIRSFLATMTDEEKDRYKIHFRKITREIEKRRNSVTSRKFFRNRAILCYKLAYIKANMRNRFEELRTYFLNKE